MKILVAPVNELPKNGCRIVRHLRAHSVIQSPASYQSPESVIVACIPAQTVIRCLTGLMLRDVLIQCGCFCFQWF